MFEQCYYTALFISSTHHSAKDNKGKFKVDFLVKIC